MTFPEIVEYLRITLYLASVLLLLPAILVTFVDKRGIILLVFSAIVTLAVFFIGRAYLKQFFPFTDKVESFATCGILIAIAVLAYRDRISKAELSLGLVLAAVPVITASLLEHRVLFPPPFLRTIWYPLHVPLSFAAYAFWTLAAVHSAIALISKRTSLENVAIGNGFSAELNRNGFVVFTIAMIFGGIWGYVAWGAHFMWDPKVLWSAILWFYYGNMLHIDNLPKLAKWKKPLFILGFFLILTTFVGTGFFTRSIHRF